MVERWYSLPAVAEQLDVSLSTVYRLIRARRLEAVRMEGSSHSKRLRVPASALAAYQERAKGVLR